MACAVAEPDPRGDFPAWLATRGMKPTFADAMERELGISDYEELLACAEDTQVTAELLGAARDRLPFAFYAVLRRLVRALTPRQRQRWWWRQHRRSRSREPLSGNGQDDGKEERARDDESGGGVEEDDEEPGGCASHCEGVLASRAVLDAIVATLSSLSCELLQSAQRFRCLEPALPTEVVTQTPRMCASDGRTGGYCIRPSQSTPISREAEVSQAVEEASPGFREDCFDVTRIKKDPYEEANLVPDAGTLVSDCLDQRFTAVLATPRLKEEVEEVTAFEDSESPPEAGEWEDDTWPTQPQGNAEWSHNQEDTAPILPQPPTDAYIYPDYAAKPSPPGRRCIPTGRPYNQRQTLPPPAPPPPAVASHITAAATVGLGGGPFTCATCGLGFGTKRCAQAHARTHTHAGGRAFSCEVCGKAFTLRCNLYRHKQMHAADKPFECSACGRRFSKRMHLRVHFSAMHKVVVVAPEQGAVAAAAEGSGVGAALGGHGRNGHLVVSGYGHRAL
ncbi:uncharacterized protein LOC144947614 [Lampetra fluviatilis]